MDDNPRTPDELQLVAEFERLQSSREELPAFYTIRDSIWFSDTTGWSSSGFASDKVAEECMVVKQKLQSMLQPYEQEIDGRKSKE